MIKELGSKRGFLIVFPAIIALEIFLVSSIPGSTISSKPDFSILYHFAAFFLLNFFLLIFAKNREKNMDKTFALVLIISLVYAVLDEFHQFFVPLRSPDIMDFLVDSAGILLSAIIYMYFPKKITGQH